MAKLLGALGAGALALHALPILLRPPDPPPLGADVGLPRLTTQPHRPHPGTPSEFDPTGVGSNSEATHPSAHPRRRVHAPPSVPAPPPVPHASGTPQPVAAPPPAPAPPPVAATPPPAPAPPSSADDGSEEFAPH
jgi:hypothetical protein